MKAWPLPPVARLATMHGKERVIVPVLEEGLGTRVEVVPLDTDRFGTFTRDVARVGTQLDAARAKARAAIASNADPGAGLASEGSFGPHPHVPFVAGAVEIVLLVDGELELVGRDVTFETNYDARTVPSREEARRFAEKIGFPTHALVVRPARGDGPITKGVIAEEALEQALAPLLDADGEARLETDMRAHVNPTRMQSIERATRDLVRVARSTCPRCHRPGWVVVERVGGRPCADCGEPTLRARAEVLACVGCALREERELGGAERASPHDCPRCNP